MPRLDNFAVYLNKYPEMIGYVAFYRRKGDSLTKIKARIEKVKKYLVTTRQVNSSRIIIIDAGIFDSSITILQPVDKNAEPPNFGFSKS